MAGILSKGIKLSLGENELTNLMEIPDLGGEKESVEVTTLADAAHMYIDGLLNYGDSLPFKFLYEAAQFTQLQANTATSQWKVTMPDGTACTFSGTGSVKLDGVGTNNVLTYTLSIKPSSEMVWSAA